MKKNKYTKLCLITFLIGAFFFAYQQGWLIIRLPLYSSLLRNNSMVTDITKKNVKLIFWHNHEWNTEQQELIWGTNTEKNCLYLINTWLTFLDEETIMDRHVSLQSAILTPSKQLLLSFDRSPFQIDDVTFSKWMWVEGLLKTLRENGIKVNGVQLLVHHQVLNDPHLDFSNPWPLQGFVQS